MSAYIRQTIHRASRTDAYRFTVDDLRDNDLARLRKQISEWNKKRDFKKRVTVRARGPILGDYTRHGGLTLGITDGSRWDVYVHDRGY